MSGEDQAARLPGLGLAARREDPRLLAAGEDALVPVIGDGPGDRRALVRVARDMAARIASGELAPGAEMPPVRSRVLAERYRVSSETIRLAYVLLAEAGLLRRPRRRAPQGWQVARPGPQEAAQ